MTKEKYEFYPENTYFVNSPVNKTFDEVLKMTTDEFRQWIIDVRKEVINIWDNHGIPPVNGYSEDEIIKQFNQLQIHDVKQMECKDELTGMLCLRNTHNRLGNACNSWFPNMLKTRIDYGGKEPKSIYDFFKEDELLDKYMPYGIRHFKRDSFYAYSQCVLEGSYLPIAKKKVKSGKEFVELFEKHERLDIPGRKNYDYWISEKDADSEYTGYDEKLMNKKWCQLSYDELKSLEYIIPKYALSNIREWNKDSIYLIRMFEKGQQMFPVGLKSFRLSFVQGAVNYPPVMAKYIWERYTEEFKNEDEVIVWDPSCGWGGRILGAMSVEPKRKLLYLGTDPNPDNTVDDKYTMYPTHEDIFGLNKKTTDQMEKYPYTKYGDIARFVNTETARAKCLFPTANKCKIWQLGSEVVQHDKEFQKYKGKVSVVFTSPPYFSREIYSEDENQSCHKFGEYESWRDGFLYETLKTAHEWLRPGGYIVWNIADVPLGDKGAVLPLQQDSIKFMESFGMEYVETIAMCLAQMPGSNRTKKDDKGNIVSTNRNEIKIDGKLFRYEPIIVFRKKK